MTATVAPSQPAVIPAGVEEALLSYDSDHPHRHSDRNGGISLSPTEYLNTQPSPAESIPPPTTDILGVHVNAIHMPAAVETIERWIESDRREYVALCAFHSIMEADRDSAFKVVLNNAGLRLPDGMPLVWLSHRAGNHQTQRVRGADLVDALCARSAQTGHRHYFYGGAFGIAQEMARRLRLRHPGLHIAGAATPGRLAIGQLDSQAVIDAVNAAAPDVLWLGLGCPKQEWWASLHRHLLEVPVVAGVGAAFDFHSGAVKQAPVWMQQNGLEWVHRLGQDPARLSRRYFYESTRFAWSVARIAAR